jgi:Zn-dependent protease with chaperone function
MRLHWKGTFFDGVTARRHSVGVELTPAGIKIIKEDGEETLWPYEDTTQTQGYYAGETVRLEKGREPVEALVIAEIEFLNALRKAVPRHSGRFHNPSTRKKRFFWITAGALGAVAFGAFLYLWGIPLAAGIVADKVPPEWEAKLGESVAEDLTAEFEECTAPPVQDSIEKILKRLDSATPEHPYTFRIHIVRSDSINALAAPGGHIIVFSGLLEATESAEELAGVLAHEMVHVLEKHSLKALFQNLSTYMLLTLIFGDAGGLTDVAHTLGTLRYSRAHEEAADIAGMEILIKAGIDPSGMVRFFETLEEKRGDFPEALKYLSTHPITTDRIRALGERGKGLTFTPRPLLPGLPWQEVAKACSTGE